MSFFSPDSLHRLNGERRNPTIWWSTCGAEGRGSAGEAAAAATVMGLSCRSVAEGSTAVWPPTMGAHAWRCATGRGWRRPASAAHEERRTCGTKPRRGGRHGGGQLADVWHRPARRWSPCSRIQWRRGGRAGSACSAQIHRIRCRREVHAVLQLQIRGREGPRERPLQIHRRGR